MSETSPGGPPPPSRPLLRVFVSSPGDVAEERALAERVLGRLAGEFADRVELRPIFWEHEPLLASATFQDQIVRPSDTEIVICILWSRLGTRLPPNFRRPDGTRYASGTEYEFEDALAGHRARGTPDLLVYRKTAEPLVSLLDADRLLGMLEQRRALDAFVERWFHHADDGSLKAAFHPFEDPARFEKTLERHLRALLLRRAPHPVRGEAAPRKGARAAVTWRDGSPFRGLEPFDGEHADIFFGRTRAVGECLDHLRRQAARGAPFLVVVGASGSGKSSLARAGLLPLLVRPGVIEGVEGWMCGVMRPSGAGEDPFLALGEALEAGLRGGAGDRGEASLPASPPASPSASPTAPELARLARHDPAGLAARIRVACAVHPTATRFVLLVDQLEELFTVPGLGEVDRVAFGAALEALVREGDTWVVATLRSDLYPRLAELPTLLRLKEGHGQVDLLPPTASEIGDLIRQPALAAGLSLEEDPDTGERLEDRLVDAAVGSPDLLPLLEFTLEELYRVRRDDGTLTLEAFRALGGVEGSLARRAEEVLSELPHAVQEAVPGLMRALVHPMDTPDGGALGAHPAPLARLRRDPATAELVEALVEARLLVTDLDAEGNAVVRIAHEALLRHWPRVAAWLEADREALKARARLRAAAFRWAEEGRNPDLLLARGKPLEDARAGAAEADNLTALERDFLGQSAWRARRATRLRALAFASLALLALLTGVSGWAARGSAESARAEANAARQTHAFMVGLLSTARPDLARGGVITAEDLLELGGRRLLEGEMAEVPASRAWAMREIASTYLQLGRPEPALVLARAADDLLPPRSGVSDSVRAEGWLLLGDIHAAENRLDSAATHLERARAVWHRRSPALASAMASRLAAVRRLQGEHDAYLALMEEHFEEALQSAGEESLERAAILSNRAIHLREQGHLLEAEALLREADTLWTRHPGQRPSQRAEFLVVLANNLSEQGRAPEAEALYREALEIQRRIHPDHPSLGSTLTGLGLLAGTLGDRRAAESWLREALSHLVRTLGEGHLQTANARVNLAELLSRDPASLDEARTLLARAVVDLEREAPRASVRSVALQNLAGLRAEGGDLDGARLHFDQAVALDSASGRWGEAALAAARRAEREEAAGEVEEARASARRALRLSEALPDPGERGALLDALQTRFFQASLHAPAEAAARAALDLRETRLPGSPGHARSLANVAWWEVALSSDDATARETAEARVLWAMRLLLEQGEGVGADVIQAEQAVSEALMALGRSLEVAAREEQLRRRLDPVRHPLFRVESLVREGYAFLAAGIDDRARAAFGAALAEAEEGLGAGHPVSDDLRSLVRPGLPQDRAREPPEGGGAIDGDEDREAPEAEVAHRAGGVRITGGAVSPHLPPAQLESQVEVHRGSLLGGAEEKGLEPREAEEEELVQVG